MSKAYASRNKGKDPNRRIVVSMTLPAWLADKMKELAREDGTDRSHWAEAKLTAIIKGGEQTNEKAIH